jgi:hypothetical protein
MAAIRLSGALFVDGTGMRSWLNSEEVTGFTNAGDWPTPETAALWKRFRDDVLSSGVQKWTQNNSKRLLSPQPGAPRPANGVYRLEIDDPQRTAWICTPDYRRVAKLKTPVQDPKPSFFSVRFVDGEKRALIERFGRDEATWFDENI